MCTGRYLTVIPIQRRIADFVVGFIVLLTTSFAERTTDEGIAGAPLVRQADLFTDMLVRQFRIN